MVQQPDLPQESPVSEETARRLFAQGQLEQSWAMYETLLLAHPNNPDMLQITALICAQRGEIDQAIERMSRASLAVPDRADLLMNIGKLWRKKGETGRALEQFQAVVRLLPDHPEARRHVEQLSQQQTQGGEQEGKESLDPRLFSEAQHCFQQGNLEQAWNLYEQLLHASPDNPDLLQMMALIRL
ncbi:MAG: tetratricopeptide repeat protein, partial [Magnetococcales bacterium]|nr:tetratricopeptide repeat protein [Magnetococcales bacterium]